jgi:hypothetical protein
MGAIALQYLVIASVLYNHVSGGYKNLKDYSGTYLKDASLYGLWNSDMQGNLNGTSMAQAFHRSDEARFLLTRRGFHWISEGSFQSLKRGLLI